ncbi:unnamed protein product [Heterobilharzia americana]|nr:unnamed protein product [Heterobilharzia americana]
MRIYFAWKMSECVCMSAGLGAYPKLSEPEKGEGPTNLRALNSLDCHSHSGCKHFTSNYL